MDIAPTAAESIDMGVLSLPSVFTKVGFPYPGQKGAPKGHIFPTTAKGLSRGLWALSLKDNSVLILCL